MSTNDEGPAFPVRFEDWQRDAPFGMTLRDWFAGMALFNSRLCEGVDASQDANWAYTWADAMLKAREGGAKAKRPKQTWFSGELS